MMLGHWQLRGYGQWTVIEKRTGEMIERVGLWHPEGWLGIDLGWIIRRSRWNNGFATDAARAALDWAWDHVATDHIISLIQPGNAPSIRVAEKIGERFERNDSMNGGDVISADGKKALTNTNAVKESLNYHYDLAQKRRVAGLTTTANPS